MPSEQKEQRNRDHSGSIGKGLYCLTREWLSRFIINYMHHSNPLPRSDRQTYTYAELTISFSNKNDNDN